MWIIKLNSSGNMVWEKGININNLVSSHNIINSIIQTKDGGYATTGRYSKGLIFMKLNSSRNKIWHQLSGSNQNNDNSKLYHSNER